MFGFGLSNEKCFHRSAQLGINQNCFQEAIWFSFSFTHISCIHLKLIILCVSPVTKLGRIQITS